MTPEEWMERYDSGFDISLDEVTQFLGEGAEHIRASLSEIAILRSQLAYLEARCVVVSELRDGDPCDHPGCLHHVTHPCEGCGRVAGRSVPASRVLRDGEVAVDATELVALRKLFSAAGNTIAGIRNGATIAEINDAWAGVCSAQILRSQEGGA